MKRMFLVGALLLGTQAFGVTLAPGESLEWGHTVITCADASSELPRCTLVRKVNSFQQEVFYVSIEGKEVTRGVVFENDAIAKIKEYRAAGLCR
jgi:hypothetical protein